MNTEGPLAIGQFGQLGNCVITRFRGFGYECRDKCVMSETDRTDILEYVDSEEYFPES